MFGCFVFFFLHQSLSTVIHSVLKSKNPKSEKGRKQFKLFYSIKDMPPTSTNTANFTNGITTLLSVLKNYQVTMGNWFFFHGKGTRIFSNLLICQLTELRKHALCRCIITDTNSSVAKHCLSDSHFSVHQKKTQQKLNLYQ